MLATRRVCSFISSLVWLFRRTGLRAYLHQIVERVDQVDHQVREAEARLTRQLVDRQVREAEACLTRQLAQAVEAEHRRRIGAWREAGDLRGFEFKVSSQNGEDGILQEIFRRIGTTNRYFVEFGVESGMECNCAYLARERQWSGLFLEARASDFHSLRERYRDFPAVHCVQAVVSSSNIEQLLRDNHAPKELDLLSIDIDGNDYWVRQAITNWHPRVVVMEYNAFHLPPKKWVMKEDNSYRWNSTTYFGASLTSLTLLHQRLGYDLVGTDSRGVNAFFVRRDCIQPGMFLDPMLQYHFTPYGYPMLRKLDGPFVEI
jgi:hypothetical protein